MKMIEYVDVVDLRPLPGFKLWLRFSNGREGVRDFSDILQEDGLMLDPLKDEAFFRRVVLRHGVPSWPNGYEIDATNLHIELDGAGLLTSPVAAE
jgi:hypothetical protein